MAAKYFSVALSDASVNGTARNGVKSAVVVAETAADAKAALRSLHGDVVWSQAVATELAAAADLEGWKLRIEVIDPTEGVKADITVTGVASATVDSIAALAVTALNDTSINGAAYNSTTNVLKVAETTDALGDNEVNVWFYPPGEQVASVPGFIGTITHKGSGSAALTVALAADTYTVPKITAQYKDAK